MNLCRCENGHFYDREKFATCPHCANGLGGDDGVTEVYQEDPNAGAAMAGYPMGGPGVGGPAPMGGPQPVEMTQPFMGGSPGMGMQQDVDVTVPFVEAPDQSMSQVQSATTQEDDDHTMAFMEDVFSEVAGTPVGEKSGDAPVKKHVSAPCVGWLVVTGGSHIGEDFRLVTGKNFIGRGDDMDVVLSDEKSVSRNRHAIVVYEPKKHLYLVQPGESSSLVYCNDDVVLNPVQLKAYDRITVGEVDMTFIPLCNDDFNWSDILKKKES